MINLMFQRVSVQNFLSFGHEPTTFDFEPGINLLVGKNGSGKSNILQSVPFSLYGKTPRKMPKQHYVNDLNRSKCRTELTFQTDDATFQVSRLVKPDGLEIRRNGELIDSQKVRQYQRFLEQQILGEISLNLFTNLIHISINKTQPFLSLTKWQKREFIESLFSFSIYSDLYRYAFDKEKPYQRARDRAQSALKSLEKLISDKESTIQQLEEAKKKQSEASQGKKVKLEQELQDKQKWIREENIYRDLLDEKEKQIIEIKKELREIRDQNIKVQHDIEYNNKTINRKKKSLQAIKSKKKCSECGQDLPKDLLEQRIGKAEKEIDDLIQKNKELESKSIPYEAIQLKEEDKDKITKDTIELEKKLGLISSYKDQVADLESELEAIETQANSSDIDQMIEVHRKDVLEYKKKIEEITQKSETYKRYLSYLTVIKESLKDEEIKRWALQKIRPFVNKKINEYLEDTESGYRIIFNDEFEPTFSSRTHYESFSEGEKKKLDLALIFSFRDLLFHQKGVFCDILFIDEFLDSSLDAEAVKIVLDLIRIKQKEDNLKVCITSHNTGLASDTFDRTYMIDKKVFSTITGG
jgi:DNA repair exonuclease SbcCD ATPase subunit